MYWNHTHYEMAFFNVQTVCCTTEMELTKNTQTKLYSKIKHVVDREGYCLASLSHKDRDAFELVKEKVLQKLKVYIPNIEKTNQSPGVHQPTCRGVAKIDRLPEEALMLQSSPALIALFSELIGSREIYNAFDVPQVVMPGENQAYKGLAVAGNSYVCLLTMTRQDVGENANQMTVPEGTLIIYDALRAPSIMPRNPVNSHPWYGIRITYWKQSLFDRVTRNAIYLTGAFGLYVPTETQRQIQPRREFLLALGDDDARRDNVRHTCISWNEEHLDIAEMKKETEQLIAQGEPFPQQFILDGNKISGGQRRRCYHPDCQYNQQEYANINQHIRLVHRQEKGQIQGTPKACPHPDCQNKQKQYVNVKLHMTMKHMPKNETCTRMKTDMATCKEQQNFLTTNKDNDNVANVPTKRSGEEDEGDNKKFKSMKKVSFATPLVEGMNRLRNRLSLGKKYQVTSQIMPATNRDDVIEMEDALKEMNCFDSPISPLPSSPPESDDDAMDIGEALKEMKNNSIQFSPLQSYSQECEENDDEDPVDLNDTFTNKLLSNLFKGSKKLQQLGLLKAEESSDDQPNYSNMNMNRVNLPPQPRREQRCENEKWHMIPLTHVRKCPYDRPPLRQTPVSIPLSPQKPLTFDEWYDVKDPCDNNQAIADHLDKLDELLQAAQDDNSIDTEDDNMELSHYSRKKKPTKDEDDQLYPLTSILTDHPSYDERDSYDDDEYTSVSTPDNVMEEIPKQLHLQYDICLETNSAKKVQGTNIWILTRGWMLNKTDTRKHYLSKIIFCDSTYLQGRFPTPALMKADEEYRHRRCYIKTKTENKVYEIRGANTVMDAVRIFYHGIRKVNEKGRKRKEQPYCFMLCDTDLALLNAKENEVYCVKRVPLFHAATYPHNQQYFFYPRPHHQDQIEVRMDYLPNITEREQALPCGVSSVVTIPKDKKERVHVLGNFLEDKFKLMYQGKAISLKKCQELAKDLLDLCNNIHPTCHMDFPHDLEGVIKKHKEGRDDIIRYAMDALLDDKMKENSMKRIERVAMKQCLLMRDIASGDIVISRLYKKTDYFGEGDILLLGIVVYDDQFTAGLREFDHIRKN